MKSWYRQWDDFLNEAEEPKLKSSGNVEAHIDKTMANLTGGQRTEISSALDSLFSDKEFGALFTKYKANPEGVELDDKELLAAKAEEFISSQGLAGELDLPGADAALSFVKNLQDKVGSTMEEDYWSSDISNSPEVSGLSYSKDDAIVSAVVSEPNDGDVNSMYK